MSKEYIYTRESQQFAQNGGEDIVTDDVMWHNTLYTSFLLTCAKWGSVNWTRDSFLKSWGKCTIHTTWDMTWHDMTGLFHWIWTQIHSRTPHSATPRYTRIRGYDCRLVADFLRLKSPSRVESAAASSFSSSPSSSGDALWKWEKNEWDWREQSRKCDLTLERGWIRQLIFRCIEYHINYMARLKSGT